MKVSILIAVLTATMILLLRAQEKSAQENEKQRVKIEVKTIEEVQQEAPAKRKNNEADQQVFISRAAPLAEDLLTRNRSYYQSLSRDKGVAENAVLTDLELNRMSRVVLAAEGEALVILTPEDVYNARLSYYTTDGRLRWEKRLPFRDLSRTSLALKVSSDGRRVVIYQIIDEALSIEGIYDGSGNEIARTAVAGLLHMAPNGHYFYKADEAFWGYPEVYGPTLSAHELKMNAFLQPDHLQYEYRYRYRIFDDDLLVLLIIEYQRIPPAIPDSTGRRKKGSPRKNGRLKINRQMLYIYHLQEEALVFQKDLTVEKSGEYRVSFTNGRMNIKNKQFVSSFLRGPGKGIELLIADLTTRSATSYLFDTIDFIAFSADGTRLWINTLVQRNNTGVINTYSVLDLTSHQFLINSKELHVDKRTAFPGFIKTFSMQDNQTALLFYAYESPVYSLWILGNSGELQHRLAGWFHLQQKVAYLPIRAQHNEVKIDIFKSYLEVLK